MKPLAIDLYCGLGGWTAGLLAAGYDVIGFDIERHAYDGERYPAQLVIQDVLTLHGSQFKDAALIVASPPCQFFSYVAMPWTRAKALAVAVRADPVRLEKELALFNACFRLQREACEAAGHHVPLVIENVRGAIPWVGRSRANFGSYHLWGDVPALMPMTRAGKAVTGSGKLPNGEWSGFAGPGGWRDHHDATKLPGFRFDGSGGSFQTAAVNEGLKGGSGSWFNDYKSRPIDGTTALLSRTSSNSPKRKAASARIAKIPLALSTWIGRANLPPTDD